MAFDFPNAPVEGSTYTPPSGPQYTYRNGVWMQVTGGQSPVLTAQTRNRIVNGAMQISQENGTANVTTVGGHPADQWYVYFGGIAGTSGRADSGNVLPSGNKYQLSVAVTTAKPTLTAGDFLMLAQRIEGINVVDFRWGTATAKQAVLRFAVYALTAGTYCVSLRNAVNDRTGLFEYTIAAGELDKWVTKSIVIPGDTSGTWLSNTSTGIEIAFLFACGTTYQGVAGWQAGNKLATPNQVNVAVNSGTPSSTYISDVGLYLDPEKTGLAPPWQMPDEAEELQACQRYYEKTSTVVGISNFQYLPGHWMVAKRTTPSISASFNTGTGAVYVSATSMPEHTYVQNTVHSAVATATLIGSARM